MDGMITCPECKGKKTLFIAAQIDFNTRSGTQIECPVCNGSGHVPIYGQLQKRRRFNLMLFIPSLLITFSTAIGSGVLLITLEPGLIVLAIVPLAITLCGIIITLAIGIKVFENTRAMHLLEMAGIIGEEKPKNALTLGGDGEQLSLYELIDGDEQIEGH